MINTLIIIVHLIVCIAMILIVLLQTGKGASMGAMFGGAGNQTLFGNTGASTFLSKATTVAAVIFMLTSLSLAYISTGGNRSSVVNDYHPPVSTPLPLGDNGAVPGQGTDNGAPGTQATGAGEARGPEQAAKQAAPVSTKSAADIPSAGAQKKAPAGE